VNSVIENKQFDIEELLGLERTLAYNQAILDITTMADPLDIEAVRRHSERAERMLEIISGSVSEARLAGYLI
jgi:hypothetical protein